MDLLFKFISAIILLQFGSCYGQTSISTPFDCSDLKRILENEELKVHFYGSGNTPRYDTLTFIDTLNAFNCKSLTINGQVLYFLNHYPRELFDGIINGADAHRNLIGRSNLMIALLFFKKVKSGYAMVLWQVNDNANIKMTISKRKKRLRIKVTGTGVF
jgi:hypothetical protein